MIMIRASIHAKFFSFFVKIFITIFLLETLIFLSHARAESKTKECKAVDVLAEVYYYTEDTLSIGVYGDDKDKHCQFSINGATKAANQQVSQEIHSTISSIYYLKNASKKKNTEEVKNIMNKIGNNWIYLIAAPNLKNGIPDNLSAVFSKYTKQNSNCISDFYFNQSPIFYDEIFSCSVVDKQNKVLSIKISIGSFYELLLFR